MKRSAADYWMNKIETLENTIAGIEKQDETTRLFKKEYLELLKGELHEAKAKLEEIQYEGCIESDRIYASLTE